jgi:hypothetical protein
LWFDYRYELNSKGVCGESRETFIMFTAFKNFKKKRKVMRLCVAGIFAIGSYRYKNLIFKEKCLQLPHNLILKTQNL